MAMNSDFHPEELASRQLLVGIEELEREAAAGRYSTMCIRALGNAAKVLGHDAIVERAATLLRNAPDEKFYLSAITNFDLPSAVPERLRTIDSLDQLQKEFPLYDVSKLIQEIRSNDSPDHPWTMCLDGRFKEASDIAKAGINLEMVGDLLAVLGEFELAGQIANDSKLEPFRQKDVRFVMMIEFFRHGRASEAIVLLTEYESVGLTAWSRVHLALGIAGREPWRGYLFPDW